MHVREETPTDLAGLNARRAALAYEATRCQRGSEEARQIARELQIVEDGIRQLGVDAERAALADQRKAELAAEEARKAAAARRTELEGQLAARMPERRALAEAFDVAILALVRALEELAAHQVRVAAIQHELELRHPATRRLMATAAGVMLTQLHRFAPLQIERPLDRTLRGMSLVEIVERGAGPTPDPEEAAERARLLTGSNR